MKQFKTLVLFILCISIIVIPLSGYADKIITNGDLTKFDGKMTQSIASQIPSAASLTGTKDTRALLSAFLTLEFQMLIEKDKTSNISLDLTTPVYVGAQGDMASVSFNTNKGYVLIIFQSKPLSTHYAFSGSSNSEVARKALLASSDDVWEVKVEDLITQLALLMQAIQ